MSLNSETEDRRDSLNELNKENIEIEKFDSLSLLIDDCFNENKYSEAIDIIDEYYNEYLNDDKKRLILLNKKIVSLLKLEEFNDLLKVLEEKSTLSNLDNTEHSNILFYQSIAYEALDEIDLAIKSLEEIVDNISKYALVNKYLKLAILYIKARRIEDADNAYKYALLVDYNRKNEMFLLVESDLYYESKKYDLALESFMSFFLKSVNKYKYIDRYIRICIKLDRLDDAYLFYKEYINKTSIKLSKQNRYSFLKAVKELLEIMNKNDEILEINSFLDDIKPIYYNKNESTILSYIYNLTSLMSMPLTRYDKYKNIANKLFKSINNILNGNLIFVEKTNESFLYSKFNNTQLKEKELFFSHLKENEVLGFFNIDKNTILDYYYDDKLNRINEVMKVYLIKNEYKDYGYFLVTYNETYDILFEILSNILLETFNKLDSIKYQSDNKEALLSISTLMNHSFIKITSDRIEYYDNKFKEIFNINKSNITFNEFKECFLKDIYVDDFLKNKELLLKAHINDEIKTLKFINSEFEGAVYSLVSDETIMVQLNNELTEYYHYQDTDFYTLNHLKEKIEKNEDSYSLIGLFIKIIEDDDVFNKRNSKLKQVYKLFNDIFIDDEFYYIGENKFLIFTLRIDKRVIDSKINKLKEEVWKLFKFSFTLRESSMFGFYSKSLKNKTFAEVSNIIEYGFSYSLMKDDIVSLDNLEKKDYSLYKTYETIVVNMIKEEKLEIEYHPIIDKENNMIHYFIPKYIIPYELDEDIFNRIIYNNDLETKIDFSLIEKTFKNTKELNNNIRYIIKIHKESITNTNFVKKLSLLFKENNLRNKIYLEVDHYNFKSYIKGLESIKNSGIKLTTTIDNMFIDDDLSMFNIIFISKDIENRFVKNIVYGIKEILNKEIIISGSSFIKGTLLYNKNIKPYSFDKIKKL